jgi:hypothetical protein
MKRILQAGLALALSGWVSLAQTNTVSHQGCLKGLVTLR